MSMKFNAHTEIGFTKMITVIRAGEITLRPALADQRCTAAADGRFQDGLALHSDAVNFLD
jgi:hypothetical protein